MRPKPRRYTLRDGSLRPMDPLPPSLPDPAHPWELKEADLPYDISQPLGSDRPIYTVSEIAQKIQDTIADRFESEVWVEGELSQPRVHSSGHLWFDLKDEGACLRAVMWRTQMGRLKFRPEHGMKVLCAGRITFWPPRGELKMVVHAMEPKGLGALQLAFEQLKEKLQNEGLFAPDRKRPLPVFPQRVGLVTSPQGAAIDDMLKILRGHVSVVLWPTRVQGDGAAASIARGIRELNQRDDLDLLIIGRGGGSLEDLWAFNEEEVARAIFQSRLPVISAVGHEKDVTISDLVADVRAPTPTKAAELVVAQRRSCLERLIAILEEPSFIEPERWLEELGEEVEESRMRLLEEMGDGMRQLIHRLQVLNGQLIRCSPQALLVQEAAQLNRLASDLTVSMQRAFERSTQRLRALAGRLEALSPLAVLERGYSLTFGPNGEVIRQAQEVKPGQMIRTRLFRGQIDSRVEAIWSPSHEQEGSVPS